MNLSRLKIVHETARLAAGPARHLRESNLKRSKYLSNSNSGQDRTSEPPKTKNQEPMTIAITDQQIDALVYELYGLTEDESRVVEGAAASVRPAAGLEAGGR